MVVERRRWDGWLKVKVRVTKESTVRSTNDCVGGIACKFVRAPVMFTCGGGGLRSGQMAEGVAVSTKTRNLA